MTKKKQIVKKSKALKREPFSRSPVDIIIPFHGQYQKVTRLVESILFATKSNPYQICLVDDCSTNERYIDLIKEAPQTITFQTPEQLGFAGALRYGFERTEQPWVVFMHSDCVVSDQNWLIEMGQSLLKWNEQKKPVKMVSARTNNPGEGVSSLLRAKHREKGEDVVLEDVTSPLYCAMCPRELFNHIGGFLKEYPFGWYEDEELAYRMRHYGYKQGVCGNSWVEHHGGATFEALWKERPEVKDIMEENRTRCIEDIKLLAAQG
jgi:GT2 family glycosyltransferase